MRALLSIALVLGACVIQQPADPQQPQPDPAPQTAYAGERAIQLNGRAATEQDMAILEQLEAQWGAKLPDGAYWYDNQSGAAGPWGGPAGGVIQAGLGLGGELPADASGGGDGTLTNVFINGRELHPTDVANLQAAIGDVYEGRWFVYANGDFGQEGGPVLGNLIAIARQNGASSSGDSYYSSDQNGSVFVGGGCVSVSVEGGSYYGSGC